MGHINKTTQKGQVLVIIVFITLIALGAGLAMSSRFIKNVSTGSSTDSASRALDVAESAVERILLVDNTTLKEYIDYGSCGSSCLLQIVGVDGVVATASVALSRVGGSTENLPVSLSTTDTVEVSLESYADNANLSVCWNVVSGSTPAVVGLFVYGNDGSLSLDNYAYNSIGSLNSDNGFTEAISGQGYSNCFTVLGKQNPRLLRLKSIYSDVEAFVIASGGSNIPTQGILIESTGTVSDSVKKVSVVKSDPFLPAQFDYILNTTSTTFPLSN